MSKNSSIADQNSVYEFTQNRLIKAVSKFVAIPKKTESIRSVRGSSISSLQIKLNELDKRITNVRSPSRFKVELAAVDYRNFSPILAVRQPVTRKSLAVMQTSTKQLDLGLDEDRVDDIRESQALYKMPAMLSRVSGFKTTSLKYLEARAESAKSMNEIK